MLLNIRRMISYINTYFLIMRMNIGEIQHYTYWNEYSTISIEFHERSGEFNRWTDSSMKLNACSYSNTNDILMMLPVQAHFVTGSPYPLAGSVERPRGGAYWHDVANEVSSVPPQSQLQTDVSDPYPTYKYGSHILWVWPYRLFFFSLTFFLNF